MEEVPVTDASRRRGGRTIVKKAIWIAALLYVPVMLIEFILICDWASKRVKFWGTERGKEYSEIGSEVPDDFVWMNWTKGHMAAFIYAFITYPISVAAALYAYPFLQRYFHVEAIKGFALCYFMITMLVMPETIGRYVDKE